MSPTLGALYMASGSNCMCDTPTTNPLPSLWVNECFMSLLIGSCQLLSFARQHKDPKATEHRKDLNGKWWRQWLWEQNLDLDDRRHWKKLEFVLRITLLRTDNIKSNKRNYIANRKRNFSFLLFLRAFTLENCNFTIK